jgi:hypothetical protein
MKMAHHKILIALATLFISLIHFACSPGKQMGDINVIDARKTNEPKEDLLAHKQYDVEVYRINFMGEMYKVRYYRKENNKIVSHAAMYGINEDFNKAAYKWLTDSSVSIRLYNTVTNKEKKIEVFGKGSTSGIIDDK